MSTKVEISERAALARINRILRPDGRRLCKARPGSLTERRHGRYYLIAAGADADPDSPDAQLVMSCVDIADFARGCGALRRHETLEELPAYPGQSLGARR